MNDKLESATPPFGPVLRWKRASRSTLALLLLTGETTSCSPTPDCAAGSYITWQLSGSLRIDDYRVPMTGEIEKVGSTSAIPDFVEDDTPLRCTASYVQRGLIGPFGDVPDNNGVVCELKNGGEFILELYGATFDDALGTTAVPQGPVLSGSFFRKFCYFSEIPAENAEVQTRAEGSIHLPSRVVDSDYRRERSFRRVYEAQPKPMTYLGSDYSCPMFRIEFDWEMVAEARDVTFYSDAYCGH